MREKARSSALWRPRLRTRSDFQAVGDPCLSSVVAHRPRAPGRCRRRLEERCGLLLLRLVLLNRLFLGHVESQAKTWMYVQGALERKLEVAVLTLVLDGSALLGAHADR